MELDEPDEPDSSGEPDEPDSSGEPDEPDSSGESDEPDPSSGESDSSSSRSDFLFIKSNASSCSLPSDIDEIDRLGSMLIKQGRINELERFLDSFPDSLRQLPSLLSLRATLFGMQGKLQQADSLFQQILPLVSGRLLARTLLRLAVVLRGLGHYKKALRQASLAGMIALRNQLQLEMAEAIRLKGHLFFCLGDVTAAIDYQVDALNRYQILAEAECASLLCLDLGIIYERKNFATSRDYYLRAERYWLSIASDYHLVTVYNNLAVLYTTSGDYDVAASYFDRALQRADGHSLECYLWCGLGELFLELEIYYAAQILFDRAEECASSDHYLLFCLSLLKARLFAQLGLFEKSLNLLQASQPAGSFERAALCLAWGEIELQRGGCPEPYFERCLSLTHDELITSCASFFLSLLKNETPSSFLACFEHRYVLCAKRFQTLPPFWRDKVLSFEERLGIFRRQLRTFNFVELPPQLEVRMFGPFWCQFKDRRVYFSWHEAQNLFCLLLFYRKPFKKRVICEMLWPGVSKKIQDSRFKDAIKILRKAVPVVKYEAGFYSFNLNIDYSLDIESWEKLNGGGSISDFKNMRQLAVGPFLSALDTEWARRERQRLYLEWVEAHTALVEFFLEQGQLDEAYSYLEELLQSEELNQQVQSLAMRYFLMRNQPLRVISCFEKLHTGLYEQFGVSPSEEVLALYRQAVRGHGVNQD